MAGGRPPGLPKTGGRKPGSPNKLQVTEAMRKDILTAYKRLGGVAWLVKWAQANETEFVGKVLSHVLPAAPRDEPSATINSMLVNADTLTDMQAASRIAFALASAAQQLEPPARIIEGEHVKPAPAESVPAPAPQAPEPAPPPEPTPESEQREVAHFGTGREQGVKRRRNLI